ncbi:NAD-dependent epimerase/dehydratase family protein [Roseomonas nepalensis]|uniref:NAD-dependent epimerase/dehydratase family protein n=1 Tax=Muricoccus nepalensis TaxID=1854500 RepID=A0A502FIS0_9PROT|nr:GDP-mannose 4,6-dehydratase [Roseomonas nepalensis]TPG49269.1 NAD-dependent epimerase/dehydratase family protein [Roseomonas nepalensis]
MSGRPGRPARILVTGAGGFVGRHMLVALRTAFPEAALIGARRHMSEGPLSGADETVELDIDDGASMVDAVAAVRPDAVLHLAAYADVGASFRNQPAVWRTNVLGTVALGEAVLQAAPGASFLMASSGEVYGLAFQSSQSVAEDTLLAPANPYAASKAAADLAVGEMALRGLRAVRLRTFTHTGAGQANSFSVAAFAHQIARIEAGRQPAVLRTGALDRWRDFLDVRDVCSAYVAALSKADLLAPGVALNICSGTPRRIGDILQTLLRLSGVEAAVEQDAARLRPTDVERVRGNSGLARQVLGWSPLIPWEETLSSVLTDWRARVAAGE